MKNVRIIVVLVAMVLSAFSVLARAENCPKGDVACQKIKARYVPTWPESGFWHAPGENNALVVEDWEIKSDEELAKKIAQIKAIAPQLLFIKKQNPLGFRIDGLQMTFTANKKGEYILTNVDVSYKCKHVKSLFLDLSIKQYAKDVKESKCTPIKGVTGGYCLIKDENPPHVILGPNGLHFIESANELDGKMVEKAIIPFLSRNYNSPKEDAK